VKHISIGMDIGHSRVKVRAALTTEQKSRISIEIPTVVTPAIQLGNDKTRKEAESDTVQIGSEKFFVGKTALRQGQPESFTGESADWISTPQHDALMLAAWRSVLEQSGERSRINRIHLVLGLPAKYYNGQREALKQRVVKLLTPTLGPTQTLKVFIQNQAEAPLQWISLNPDGTENHDRNLENQTWGTIEIGHYTTDFSFCDRGSMIENASTSCAGVSTVYTALSAAMTERSIPTNVEAVEEVVRHRKLKNHDLGDLLDRAKEPFVATVVDQAKRVFGQKVFLMDGLIVAGGGAPLVLKELKQLFGEKVSMDEDPRMVVAEGFCRVGLLTLQHAK
jgi:plasmid segregation protein ParM